MRSKESDKNLILLDIVEILKVYKRLKSSLEKSKAKTKGCLVKSLKIADEQTLEA